jgi:hypothetical protein
VYATRVGSDSVCQTKSPGARLGGCWNPYLGFRTGVTEFVDPSLKSGGVDFRGGTPKSVEVRADVGITEDIFNVNTLFGDSSKSYRPFPHVAWASDKASAPADARTRLNISGWTVNIGLQLHVKDKK